MTYTAGDGTQWISPPEDQQPAARDVAENAKACQSGRKGKDRSVFLFYTPNGPLAFTCRVALKTNDGKRVMFRPIKTRDVVRGSIRRV